MKRKLVSGIVAGVAALAVTAGGVTYAAFSDFHDISGNSAGAEILRLNLDANGGVAKLDFGSVDLGGSLDRAVWVTSDGASGPDATVSLSLADQRDGGGTCVGNLGKALAEQSLGNGCTITDNVASGTADRGKLSQVLTFAVGYYPAATDAASCASGTLQSIASGAIGTIIAGGPTQLVHADSTPVVLHPGDGVCLGVTASWPSDPSGSSTLDAAAQGDDLDFELRVDLVQQ